jgi:hypothetical protein
MAAVVRVAWDQVRETVHTLGDTQVGARARDQARVVWTPLLFN